MDTIISSIIRQYDFNLSYAKALVIDIPDKLMTYVPAAGLFNHPAFTLGHLVSGSALIIEDLGEVAVLPSGWTELFQRKGPDDQTRPDEDSDKYPAKNELLSQLELQHNKVKYCLAHITDEQLNKETKWRFDIYLPTLLDVIMFMCINHEAMHLGQLAAWRRAMNLTSALKTL